MSDDQRIRIILVEDLDVIDKLDKMAKREGTTRTALIRRALRQMLFLLPSNSTYGIEPQSEEEAINAAE